MIFGFKPQFVPFVLDGTKTHTIRAPRADGSVPRVGQTAHCYKNVRQRSQKLLGAWPIVRVESIVITEFFNKAIPLAISIEGNLLKADEAEQFLWRDGFREPRNFLQVQLKAQYPSIQQAAEFWRARLADGKHWKGFVIHWDYTKAVVK